MAPEQSSSPVCQLKTGDSDGLRADQFTSTQLPKTASEWFSKKWPGEAECFGCPFLEAKYEDAIGVERVNPIALNEIFFASILVGDEKLGHKVVYYTPDQQFYFKDPAEKGKFKPTTEAKLKTLLSLYILRCGEDLQDSTPKFNLFVRFRKDQELQRIVDKAKSLLSAGKSFFSLDSPNVRIEGAEVYGKTARIFVNDLDGNGAGKEFDRKRVLPGISRLLLEKRVGVGRSKTIPGPHR